MPVRERVRTFLETSRLQRIIIAVIVVNAATLGLETSAAVTERYGTALTVVDHAALYVFVAELAAKVYAHRLRFFRDPWNLFDTVIVALSLLPVANGLSVLRALRILRALRLISVVPSLRRVVTALLTAVPGMTSIVLLLGLVLYVAAVMGTKLYHATSPGYFGDLPTSLFTLFQMMTGDGWSDITREVMSEHPSAWLFFVLFMLVCTFVVLNLFIAVVVNAMEEDASGEAARATRGLETVVLAELSALRAEVRELRERTPAGAGAGAGPEGRSAAGAVTAEAVGAEPAAAGPGSAGTAPRSPSPRSRSSRGRSSRGARGRR
ncbi:ion transporter [Streptosporangium sp. NPDC048047]|uniref:ion transporter n=1 Tax=Streptosporangium sp. NPDC048047 TaxID=3155748 RepID=UPI00342B2770